MTALTLVLFWFVAGVIGSVLIAISMCRDEALNRGGVVILSLISFVLGFVLFFIGIGVTIVDYVDSHGAWFRKEVHCKWLRRKEV